MKKRLISALLVLLIALSVCGTTAFAEIVGDDLAETAANIPTITRVSPSANGATITWTPFEGAVRYMVFYEKPEGGWKKLGESRTTSFEHKSPASNTAYKYTVRAADSSGSFISGYDRAGFTFTTLSIPQLASVTSVYGGHRLTWNAVDGATCYRVYVAGDNGWQAIAQTAETSYLNVNAISGAKYAYTVRCWDAENRCAQSFYNRRGVSGVYIASPQITGFTPVKGGVSFSWNAVDGASRYSVFMKLDGKWKKLCNTDQTSYTHTGLSGDTLYTYTVRCIDKNGAFCSGYNTAGDSVKYYLPPRITAVEDSQLSWESSDDIEAFRIYRKEFRGSWTVLGDTYGNTYTDTSAENDVLYTYTVRGVDENAKLITHFYSDDIYYLNGKPADGSISVGGTTLYFSEGRVNQGYVTIDGKMYYYNSSGVLQRNGLVGSSQEGYRYADENGVVQLNYTGLASNSAGTWYVTNGLLDRTLRTAVTIKGVDYIVINGRATAVETEKQLTLFRALKLVDRLTKPTMSKSEKLRICFDYVVKNVVYEAPRIPDTNEDGWTELYANDVFLNEAGNCFSFAASFAYLAKAIGYSEIYVCNNVYHGWVEVDGYVYDPQQSQYNDVDFYALTYDDSLVDGYESTIDRTEKWSHVKI